MFYSDIFKTDLIKKMDVAEIWFRSYLKWQAKSPLKIEAWKLNLFPKINIRIPDDNKKIYLCERYILLVSKACGRLALSRVLSSSWPLNAGDSLKIMTFWDKVRLKVQDSG